MPNEREQLLLQLQQEQLGPEPGIPGGELGNQPQITPQPQIPLAPQETQIVTPQMAELQLKEQLLETLLPLRNLQMQKELGAIAQERQAEITKEANQLIEDNSKTPGKQAGSQGTQQAQDPRAALLQQMLAQGLA